MRKFQLFFGLCLSLFLLVGCTSSMAVTFTVESGEFIRVELDTSDGHSISFENPFEVSFNDSVCTFGTFISVDQVSEYLDAVELDENAVLLDEGTVNGYDYYFWSYGGSEWNYVIALDGSLTGILLCNNVSEASARAVFSRLGFTVMG